MQHRPPLSLKFFADFAGPHQLDDARLAGGCAGIALLRTADYASPKLRVCFFFFFLEMPHLGEGRSGLGALLCP